MARLYLAEVELEALIEGEVGGRRERVGERRWGQGRDAVYKRKDRALRWLRGRMLAA